MHLFWELFMQFINDDMIDINWQIEVITRQNASSQHEVHIDLKVISCA